MPVKQKRAYHTGKKTEKHTKRFIKTYAPYLPLMFIVGFGLFISLTSNINKTRHGDVLAYATQMSDPGLLEQTNLQRQDNGLEALQFNEVLDQAAQSKAEDMAKRNYWSHNTPDGQEPWIFIDEAGYEYFKAAENLAYGFDTSRNAVIGWMNSPSHRANILDADLREVGFGIADVPDYQGNGPETVVVAMYGLPTPSKEEQSVAVANRTEQQNKIPPPSTLAATNSPTEVKKISYAQLLTGSSAPWISLAIGLSIGLMLMYLFLKHTRNIIRAIKNGEKFILHHPLLDTTIVALLALATIVIQTAGVIH